MLLTLTDGLLPVKKFDRSFRGKSLVQGQVTSETIYFKEIIILLEFCFKNTNEKFYPLSILAFVIKISIL